VFEPVLPSEVNERLRAIAKHCVEIGLTGEEIRFDQRGAGVNATPSPWPHNRAHRESTFKKRGHHVATDVSCCPGDHDRGLRA
jgi:hypothetical protein